MVKRLGLTFGELEYLDIGDVIEIVAELLEQSEDMKEATQEDFDNF